MSNNSAKIGAEPIAGYVLRKRLGAGGYGEVWLADAPGGLQKAVKIIFGSVDDTYAASELKSLQRIKEVNHPFLLSLERIEVVEGRVVIITELAEASLLDRFQHYRRRGEPGIPRRLLLDFLHDTADALDFLANKHSLQHLDVKPGNLLLIADRVKVADFGLVKDLQDNAQSIVSGLTPSYSAPEIFDGRPDFRSDQYSLAVVYMEMLTGSLPFSGTSTAEIARQHLGADPTLDALPPADRPVVARALAKNPLDRYASCRQFIEQLQKVRGSAIPVTAPVETESKTSTDAPLGPKTDTLASGSGVQHEFLQAPPLAEAELNYIQPRCLFMGIGGIGSEVTSELRRTLSEDCDARLSTEEHAWLAVDTSPEQIKRLSTPDESGGFEAADAVLLPIYKPVDYRDASPQLLSPLSRRWLYNIPKSQQTEGVRPIALLAMLDHYESLKAKIQDSLERLIGNHNRDESCDQPLRIYLTCSLQGGTGSGLFCEFASLIRRTMSELRFSNYRICGVVSLATALNQGAASMPAAAALASLSELLHFMQDPAEIPTLYFRERNLNTSARPFDWITVVDGGVYGSSADIERCVRQMARLILLDSQTAVASMLSETRIDQAHNQLGWLRTGTIESVELMGPLDAETVARICLNRTLSDAREYLLTGKDVHPQSSTETDSRSPDADLPLTTQARNGLADRIVEELGILCEPSKLCSNEHLQESAQLLRRWARRLTKDRQITAQQMKEDIASWKRAVATVAKTKAYNWQQITQLQLDAVEKIIVFKETELPNLITAFQPYKELLGSGDAMLESSSRYMQALAEYCLKMLREASQTGRDFGKRIDGWINSMAAEQSAKGDNSISTPDAFPSEINQLVQRVCASLESNMDREILMLLDCAMHRVAAIGKPPLAAGELNFNQHLTLATELVSKLAEEMEIDLDRQSKAGQSDAVGAETLPDIVPTFATHGGKVYRVAVTPSESDATLRTVLENQGMTHATTVLPGPSALGTFVMCDAERLNVPQILSSICRPTPQTLQLAERLHTRVDVEWGPIAGVFESSPEGVADASPSSTAAPVIPTGDMGGLSQPTQQISPG